MGVDELIAGRRHRREDPEPAEGIVARALTKGAGRNARAADAVVAVTPGDGVALELVLSALVPKADSRPLRLEIVNRDVGHLEEQREIRVEPREDQILDDLGLAVDRDRSAAGELAERNAMALAVELELDAVVDDPLPLQAVADTGVDEEVRRALLEHTGADTMLDVVSAAVLEHDGLDAFAVKEVREHQPGGTGADDRDLGAHQLEGSSSSNTR